MISYLKGKVIAKTPDSIITDTGGVGYKVFVPEKLLSAPEGKEIELYCHLHLKRDETLELYGLSSLQALEVFETLNSISGIGPKAALSLASLGTMEQLKGAIEKGDASFFQGVHGIGKKKIQKIILELTGKFKTLEQTEKEKKEDKDALDALVSLGFSRDKAREALLQIPSDLPLEEKVKEALKIAKR